jgi:hypothetical protein
VGETTGDNNMSNKKIRNRNKEIIEFETDDSGYVINDTGLIQIKLWRFKCENLILVGTITFTHQNYDMTFKGILNKKNSWMLFDCWFNCGISDYVIKRRKDEIIVDYLFNKYSHLTEQLNDYFMFKNDCPEYRQLKIVDRE